jgi:hypothetical protein
MNTKCIVCGKELKTIHYHEDDITFCLDGGATFRLEESYGSAIIDDMGDKQIIVCDQCIKDNADKIDSVKIVYADPQITYTNFAEMLEEIRKPNNDS